MNTIIKALQAARDCIQQDRTSFADCSMGPDNTMAPDDAATVAEYDTVLALVDEALAQQATPEPVGEPVQPTTKPYAYEYGQDNGDGTYSVVIDRGSLNQKGPGAYEYGPPRTPHKDWPVKELFLHAAPSQVEQAEPTAWLCTWPGQGAETWHHVYINERDAIDCKANRGGSIAPLYTHPTPAPQQVPMTDEEAISVASGYAFELGTDPTSADEWSHDDVIHAFVAGVRFAERRNRITAQAKGEQA